MHGLDKIRELNDIAESKELDGDKAIEKYLKDKGVESVEWNSEDYHPELPDTEILIVNLDN